MINPIYNHRKFKKKLIFMTFFIMCHYMVNARCINNNFKIIAT